MASPSDDSRIVIPYMPSLFHISMIKVAVPIFNDVDVKTMRTVCLESKRDNSEECEELKQENNKVDYAKEKLSFVPVHLRECVLKAVMGMHWAASQWRFEHSFLHNLNGNLIFYWRPDGTVDRIRTAQHLVLNTNININQRFKLACSYFLETSVESLWAEIEKSCHSVACTFHSPICLFWINWIRSGRHVPWRQAIRDCANLQQNFRIPIPRFSILFSLLQPKDRNKYFDVLMDASSDDYRFCLYAVTKEEEDQIVKMNAASLLLLYLDWPLQSLFLEMADKMWSYMTYDDFKAVLSAIYTSGSTRDDFDYQKLCNDFWDKSPDNFKKETESFFHEMMKNKPVIGCVAS